MSDGFRPRRAPASKEKQHEVIVLDDEEPTGEKPPEKRVKIEPVFVCPLPPPPSLIASPKLSEVAELQQKLEKSERMYKKACEQARKEQLRAERAEALLDSKREVKANILNGSTGDVGLMEKLTKQLEAARERANSAAITNIEIVRERDASRGEADNLRCIIRRLEGEVQRVQSGYYYYNNSELSRDYFELRTNLDQARLAEGNMARALTTARQENIGLLVEVKEMKRREEEAKKTNASEEIIALQAEIEVMKRKEAEKTMKAAPALDALKEEMMEMKRREEEEKKKASAVLLSTQETLKRVLTTNGSSGDLFQCCFPSTDPDSISLDSAVSKLQAKLDKCGKKEYFKYSCDKGSGPMNIKCAFCQVNIRNRMVNHFLTPKHLENVRGVADATVSLPAVQHWLQHLQQAIEWKEDEEKESEEEDNGDKSDEE